jgi:hypothetical protein
MPESSCGTRFVIFDLRAENPAKEMRADYKWIMV